ncbi:MAG: hypothetical protein COX57_08615 [Alphaproteobacteria bacterium CG_4_10_14_0_2_um_filter_63_37]|nr:MAG: hypothetical protein AUJ55_12235 [Proteobacteria bacterium CG1_02_64_396]PJA24414.1 MAG: hypothetical protein COX57_08615 [Alphaproteobacteria bacterium CG_4_10_14_0_2_um_filter_63_37]
MNVGGVALPGLPHYRFDRITVALGISIVLHAILLLVKLHMDMPPEKARPPMEVSFLETPQAKVEKKRLAPDAMHGMQNQEAFAPEVAKQAQSQTTVEQSPANQPIPLPRTPDTPPPQPALPSRPNTPRSRPLTEGEMPEPKVQGEQTDHPDDLAPRTQKTNPDQPPLMLFPDSGTLAQIDRENRIARVIDEQHRRQDTVSINTREFKYASYFSKMKDKVEYVWQYPEAAQRQGLEGRLLIKFSIGRTGELVGVEVLRSSGSDVLDRAAIEALRKGAPYAPLPEEWELDQLNITATFEYIMQMFGISVY